MFNSVYVKKKRIVNSMMWIFQWEIFYTILTYSYKVYIVECKHICTLYCTHEVIKFTESILERSSTQISLNNNFKNPHTQYSRNETIFLNGKLAEKLPNIKHTQKLS